MAKTGDIFTIPDPNLKIEQLEQVQIEIAAMLEHGLPEKGLQWPPHPTGPEIETSENIEEIAPSSNEDKEGVETEVSKSVS